MSYSIAVTAPTKAEVLVKVAAELDKVVQHQPSHKRDQAQALAAAASFVGALADDDTRDVHVSMHGSLSGPYADGDYTAITSASVGVTATLKNR